MVGDPIVSHIDILSFCRWLQIILATFPQYHGRPFEVKYEFSLGNLNWFINAIGYFQFRMLHELRKRKSLLNSRCWIFQLANPLLNAYIYSKGVHIDFNIIYIALSSVFHFSISVPKCFDWINCRWQQMHFEPTILPSMNIDAEMLTALQIVLRPRLLHRILNAALCWSNILHEQFMITNSHLYMYMSQDTHSIGMIT